MRKILQIALLSLGIMFTGFTTSYAQKIAYVDSDAILTELPAKKQMDVELENFRKELQDALAAQEEEGEGYDGGWYGRWGGVGVGGGVGGGGGGGGGSLGAG